VLDTLPEGEGEHGLSFPGHRRGSGEEERLGVVQLVAQTGCVSVALFSHRGVQLVAQDGAASLAVHQLALHRAEGAWAALPLGD